MGLRYSLAVAACVIEDIPARKAIRRSIELSKESRGRIFVLGLLIFAIQLGLVMITQMFFFVAAYLAVKKGHTLPAWMLALQQLVGFFTNSFIGPMYATGLTLFYYDQRIRKEGFDIEWMMEAAGMTRTPAAELVLPAEFEAPAPTHETDTPTNTTDTPFEPVPLAEPGETGEPALQPPPAEGHNG